MATAARLILPPDADVIRTCYFRGPHGQRWRVRLIVAPGRERRRVTIEEAPTPGAPYVLAYDEGGFGPSPLHAEESDQTMYSVVALATHDATHDRDDRRIPCTWDADALNDAAGSRWRRY